MMILLFAAIVLFIIAIGAWWYLFFGRPNPPLSQTSVSIQGASGSSLGTAATSVASASATAAAVASTSGAATSNIDVAASSNASASAPIVDGENPPLAAERLSIDGAVFSAEVASTGLEQTRGLSFRPSLGAHDGMLFLFGSGSTQTFWMKDMNFPLDMIWISGNTVVGFTQNAPAPASGVQLWSLPIYSSPPNTDKVLEVNAGTVAKYNIKVGDSVMIGAVK